MICMDLDLVVLQLTCLYIYSVRQEFLLLGVSNHWAGIWNGGTENGMEWNREYAQSQLTHDWPWHCTI